MTGISVEEKGLGVLTRPIYRRKAIGVRNKGAPWS